MIDIIQKRKYTYWISGALAVFSVAAIAVFGLRLGLDFKGGTMIEIRFAKTPAPQVSEVQDALATLDLRSLTVQATGDNGAIIRFLASDETVNDKALEELKKTDPDLSVLRTDFIGASVSGDIRKNAIWGTLLSVIAIAAYIAFAFRKVSHPIGSWDYGWGAVIALAHDLLITTGFFAFFGKFLGVEVGVPFIAALLTILGYSVNDTIVVYDRIRENLLRSRAKSDFEVIVNRSVNETMSRSINTSLTVLIVLAAVAAFGGEGIRWFAIALLLGVSFGTYSSIFVASALLVSRYKMRTR
ncbi:MAG: protein translocase subunit SecF [Candidatus Moranbacteria bacterium]|nr:protein translocase subunit SecF [Candidatus Moranbacteria bacterium]